MRIDRRGLKSPFTWLLLLSTLVSIGSLIIYLTGIRFSDETLFILLDIIRYSTFIVFVCSLYAVLFGIYKIFSRISKKRNKRNDQENAKPIIERRNQKLVNIQLIIRIILYLILMAYCIGIVYLEAFVMVVSAGNGG